MSDNGLHVIYARGHVRTSLPRFPGDLEAKPLIEVQGPLQVPRDDDPVVNTLDTHYSFSLATRSWLPSDSVASVRPPQQRWRDGQAEAPA